MAASRSRKPWDLTDDETLTSFQNWQSIIVYHISLDSQWSRFLPPDGVHKSWHKKTTADPYRGLQADGAPIPEEDRQSASQKNQQLELMLGYIAGYASVISRNSIVRTSTSLNHVWQQLREYYSFASSGSHFLDLAAIKLNGDEKFERLYQRIATFYDDNLLTVNCGILHHGEAVTVDEEITPSIENTIVVLWLNSINPGLPSLVKQKFGSELRNKTLASLKPEISQNIPTLLDELRSHDETRVQRLSSSYKPQFPRRGARPKKFCALCDAKKKPGAYTHDIHECPNIPQRDRRRLDQQSGRSRAVDNEQDEQEEHSDDQDYTEDDALFDIPITRRVAYEPSPTLLVYYKAHPVRMVLDTGSTSTMIKQSFAKRIGLPVYPACQSAKQADGKSTLRVIGETHCELTRGNLTLTLDGLIVDNLENDVLAGTSFMKANDIASRPAHNLIVIQGREKVHYGSRNYDTKPVTRRIDTVLCRGTSHEVVLPGDYIDLPIPCALDDDDTWALEPRLDSPINKHVSDQQAWPPAQIIQSVSGSIRLTNTRAEPVSIKSNQHLCQVTRVADLKSPHAQHVKTLNSPDLKPRVAESAVPYSASVKLDPDNVLSDSVKHEFCLLLSKFDGVFNPAISKYNGASGPIEATVNMGPVLPPQRKGRLPQYNKNRLDELQMKFDDLEAAGVFAKPEEVSVSVEYLNTSFLVKKPSGGTRLVTSFGEVGSYSKPQPSLMPNVDQVLRDIASWHFIIVSDLLKSFYQIPLAKSSMKYCGVATPYKGIRVYQRSAMGMPGSETVLEEMMSRVLGDLIQEGKVVKLADDLYCGGGTAEEALQNWSLVLEALQRNNLRLSAQKTTICPKTTTILGWLWSQGTLRASPHRITALSQVKPPTTVQGLRSFIGAYKVLSRVLPKYCDYLHPLDSATAGKQSKDKIIWTDLLMSQFKAAQDALSDNKVITLPTPTDTIWIVTDASVKSLGIGATMYVAREKLFLAGHYNAKLRKHQVTWLPCEVEALALASAIKHFSPYIIQSRHTTQVLTDSQPCVQAYAKLQRGEFSNSSRVTSFLSIVSRYQVHVGHIKGAANLPSDFTSRNPTECPDHSCQLCKFNSETEESVVRGLSVQDVTSGQARMPFTNRAAWHATQLECPDLRRALAHLKQGTRPSKKATGLKDTKRYINSVTLSNDGLAVRKEELQFGQVKERIVIPRAVLHGLLTALHIRLDHPSQNQLKLLVNRYFYSLDLDQAVTTISTSCHQCAALKSFPVPLRTQSSCPPPATIGVSYAADVMRRYRQYIFVLRETVTSLTKTMIVEGERHDELRDALLILMTDFIMPTDGHAEVEVRVDAAPGFQQLARDPVLKQHGINLVIGRIKNVNKNPVAEKSIKELGLELLKLCPDAGYISKVTLALATARMNARIRHNGLSASERWTQRDQLSGEQLPLQDQVSIQQQHLNRLRNHKSSAASKARSPHGENPILNIGDLVYLKGEGDKTKPRDRYMIVSVSDTNCSIRKFTASQIRSRTYDVPVDECYRVPSTALGDMPRGPIRGIVQHSADTSSDSEYEDNVNTSLTNHPQRAIPPLDIVRPPAPIQALGPVAPPCLPPARKSSRVGLPPAWLRTGNYIT